MVFSCPVLGQHKTLSHANSFYTSTIAYSPTSVYFLGKTPDSKTFYSYVGYGKKIRSIIPGFISYRTFGVIPFLHYKYPKRDNNNVQDIVTAFGISPLGYEFVKPLFKQTFFSSGLSSGVVFTNKYFPTDKSRRLNYTFDIHISIQHFLFSKTAVSIGYRFHHLSNAQTGKHNPGIDSNFILFTLKTFIHVN